MGGWVGWGGGGEMVKVEINVNLAQPTELKFDWAGPSLAIFKIWYRPEQKQRLTPSESFTNL